MSVPTSGGWANATRPRFDLPTRSQVEAGNDALPTTVAALRAHSRAALGLNAGSTIGTGHQSAFFHGGILAKFMAASELASSLGGAAQWVHFMSDADLVDPFSLELPCRTEGAPGFSRERVGLAPRARDAEERTPSCARPARRVLAAVDASGLGARLPSPHASAALTRALDCLARADDSTDAATQGARAIERAMSPWVSAPVARLGTGRLMASPLGEFVLDAILRSPAECAASFNRSLMRAPGAAKPLVVDEDHSEVPLWGIDEAGRRVRLRADEARSLRTTGRAMLPRASLASGLMRLHTDLFLHGVGGARYELAGDSWWLEFLGIPLPPFGVVSADLRIAPETAGLTPPAPTHLSPSWREASWNPRLLVPGDGTARVSEPRRTLLEVITRERRRSPARRAAYEALLAQVSREREEMAEKLSALERAEVENRVVLRAWRLAQDRTWPFLLLEPSLLDGLSAQMRARAQAWAATPCSGSGR